MIIKLPKNKKQNQEEEEKKIELPKIDPTRIIENVKMMKADQVPAIDRGTHLVSR